MSDPKWINADAGAPEYNATELRRLEGAVLFKGVTDRFGARQGVHPSNDPAVTLAGTTWTVEDITAVVYPGLTDQDGPYVAAHPSESGSLDPADGTNDRVDALDLQVQDDDHDASGQRRARVVYVAGAPAADPDPPAVTANSLRLAMILVSAGGTPSPAVTIVAPFTVAAGGVLPVRDEDELPTSVYDGMVAFDQALGDLLVRANGQWRLPQRGWVPISAGEDFSSTSSIDIDLTAGGRFPAGTFQEIEITLDGATAGTDELFARVNNDTTASLHRGGWLIRNLVDDTVASQGANVLDQKWTLGRWRNLSGNTCRILILRTFETGNLPMQATTTTIASTSADATGRLEAGRLINSIRFGFNGTTFEGVHWTARGYLL